MAIFYHTNRIEEGVIYKKDQTDQHTQYIIEDIEYMVNNNISRDTHNTLEDAYSESIKKMKSNIDYLENILNTLDNYILKHNGGYSYYEYVLLKIEKIELIDKKINYINEFIKELENKNDILYDFPEYTNYYRNNYRKYICLKDYKLLNTDIFY